MARENWKETMAAIDDIIQRSPAEGRPLNDIEKFGLAGVLQQMLESQPGISTIEAGKENDIQMLLRKPLKDGALDGFSFNYEGGRALTLVEQMTGGDQRLMWRMMIKPLGQAIRISLVDIEAGRDSIPRITLDLSVIANNELRLQQVKG